MFGREQTGAKMAGSRQDKGVGRRQRSLRAEFYLKKHVGPGIELSGWNACLASLEPHRFKPQPALCKSSMVEYACNSSRRKNRHPRFGINEVQSQTK